MSRFLRTWTVGVVMAAGFGAVQCALLPSLDGLSGGQGTPDAANDARGDASVPDGGDAGRWCASLSPAPLFCDDFDDQGPFTRWTGQFVYSGATITRDGTVFRSAPNALLAESLGKVNPAMFLFLSTALNKSKVRFAYDMRIDPQAPAVQQAYAELNYINFDTPGMKSDVFLRVGTEYDGGMVTGESHLPDGGLSQHDVPLAGQHRFDAWTRVVVEVDVASTPRTLSVTIDGSLAALQTLEPALYAPGPVKVSAGLEYSSSGDWHIRYDNVTIDWE